jgi:hypothetical protein
MCLAAPKSLHFESREGEDADKRASRKQADVMDPNRTQVFPIRPKGNLFGSTSE